MLTMPLNQGTTSDSAGGPGKHEGQPKDPQVRAKITKRRLYPSEGQFGALIYDVGETEGQQALE